MGTGASGLSKGRTFSALSDAEESAFYAKQKITPSQQEAFDMYTNPNTESGSLYNFSQNMNQAVATGKKLTAEQQKVWDEINGSMHKLGQNMELTRYDHAGTVNEILSKLGISGDAGSMSVSDLSDHLVGVGYTDSRILSTSVNGFKNASNPDTFTTRQFKFTYKAKSTVKGVMPGVGKTALRGSGMSGGDNFGELLLSPKSNYTIVGVRNTGVKARSKGRPTWDRNVDQIEIIVEVG